jgi:hypothetical protein
MKTTVLILCYPSPKDCDSYLAGLAGYLGLKYRFLKPDELFAGSNNQRINCVALSGETLAAIHQNPSLTGFLTRLLDSVSFVFLYMASPNIPSNEGLNFLTGGILQSISAIPNNNFSYSVSQKYPDVSRQFSGLTFGPVNSQVDFFFNTGKAAQDTETIISIDSRPMFVRVKRGECDIFALATGKIQDIHQIDNSSITAARRFSTIAPALMFLKFVFRNYCWHPVANQACLTIDDPLLHKKYGFLDYRTLLSNMTRSEFFTTMAFIPWNFKRTQQSVAELFKKNTDRFSICVHGCDHTASEFGITDFGKANDKVKLATRRMIAHQEITGLGFDKVMVFPQGVFSTTSLKALKSNNYTAAVNSGVFPVGSSRGLELSDLMQQSIMSYEYFPLFHRRYPVNIVDFAFDLFLGKPALIVTHHEDFRGGYEEISSFVSKINSLDAGIRWRGLGEIARKSYWLKEESETQISLRMFSTTICIENNSSDTVSYFVTKCETNNLPIDGVFVNGKQVAYVISDQFLKIAIDINPQDFAEVAIIYKNPNQDSGKELGTLENMKIFARRHLSEIRDNYISKNRLLQRSARKLAKLLRI